MINTIKQVFKKAIYQGLTTHDVLQYTRNIRQYVNNKLFAPPAPFHIEKDYQAAARYISGINNIEHLRIAHKMVQQFETRYGKTPQWAMLMQQMNDLETKFGMNADFVY